MLFGEVGAAAARRAITAIVAAALGDRAALRAQAQLATPKAPPDRLVVALAAQLAPAPAAAGTMRVDARAHLVLGELRVDDAGVHLSTARTLQLHEATLAIFDQIEKTEDKHTTRRAILLTQLKHALTKHAMEEENAVYATLRTHGQVDEADHLNKDHGYVKQYLFELSAMATHHPQFLPKIRDFRAMLETHMREEEEKVFPKLRSLLSEEENATLTKAMNQEGLKIA